MYEVSTGDITMALRASSTAVFSDDTISKILALSTQANNTVRIDEAAPDAQGNVTVASGASVVLISSSDTDQTLLKPPVNAPVVIFQGKGGVIATFNDGPVTVPAGSGVTERVVVHSSGEDNIIIADGKNTLVTIGAGDTVVGGSGHDTVVAGFGNSTVVGGTGNTIVQLGGDDSDYEVTVDDGRAIVTNTETGAVTDISKVQYVQLDNGEALVFAKDELEAAVSTLYETAFGRAGDGDGIEFWFDRAREGVSLEDIADAFTQVSEFATQAGRNDEAFVNSLYLNTFGRAADTGGLDFWVGQLESGAVDRGDVLQSFASAAAAVLNGEDGEAVIIGSITIVGGIV